MRLQLKFPALLDPRQCTVTLLFINTASFIQYVIFQFTYYTLTYSGSYESADANMNAKIARFICSVIQYKCIYTVPSHTCMQQFSCRMQTLLRPILHFTVGIVHTQSFK